MGIEIPGWLQGVASVAVGVDWPQADETSLRRVADSWSATATTVREAGADGEAAVAQALGHVDGVIDDAIGDYWRRHSGGIEELAAQCDRLAAACRDTATDVEHTKMLIIGSLTVLAAEIAALTAAAIPTAGASTAGIPVATIAAQLAVRALIQQLVAQMLKHGAVNAVLSIAVEGAVEGIQIARGDRAGLDVAATTAAGVSGFVDGAVAGGVTRGAHHGLANAGHSFDGFTGAAAYLGVDLAGGVSGSIASALATGDEVTLGTITSGIGVSPGLDLIDPHVGGAVRYPPDGAPATAFPATYPQPGVPADLFTGYRQLGSVGSQAEFSSRYWDPAAGWWDYPPDSGIARDASGVPRVIDPAAALPPGTVLDRFGNPGGSYLSPAGTLFGDRALPPTSAGADYRQYEVTAEPLPPGWRIEAAQIAPWFGQPGGGVQYRIVDQDGNDGPVQELLDRRYLK